MAKYLINEYIETFNTTRKTTIYLIKSRKDSCEYKYMYFSVKTKRRNKKEDNLLTIIRLFSLSSVTFTTACSPISQADDQAGGTHEHKW